MMLDFEASYLKEQDELYAAVVKSVGEEVDIIIQRKAQASRKFARHLIELGYPQLIDSRIEPLDFETHLKRPVYPCWTVKGMPSKNGRPIAENWMLSRKARWGGSTKLLRREVEDALVLGETVPRFGFHISLSTILRAHYINQSVKSELTNNSVQE
jgi:hypothetical protein